MNAESLPYPAFLPASVFKVSYDRHRCHRGLRCEDPTDLCACILCHAAEGCMELEAHAEVCM